MAVPPTYIDLGKSAKDVFTKGYGKQQGAIHTQFIFICSYGSIKKKKRVCIKHEVLYVV